MRRLRILHVTPYYEGAWAYGGIPRVVAAQAAGLARRGHEVTVLTTDACDAARRLGLDRSGSSDLVSVRVHRNLSNSLAYHLQLFLPRGLRGSIDAIAREVDVAHLHACHNVPTALAARRLHRLGVPYVLQPNGTAPLIERRIAAKRLFDATIGRRVMERASRHIAVTRAEERDLEDLGVRSQDIRVVPNPVDLPSPHASAGAAFRDRLGIAATARLVLYLGKLTPRKRVDALVRAVASMQLVWLVIAGPDMGCGHRLRDLARDLGIESRTAFPGLLTGEERLGALSSADVVAYPGEREVFGLTAMEALALGVPVVVADDSGCGEVVKEVGGGLRVAPGDVNALRRALEAIIADLPRWRAEGSTASERVRDRFAPDRVCGMLEAVYREVVGL